MTDGRGTASSQRPKRGTAAEDSKETLYSHPDGTDVARPQNGMQLRREYSLLVLAELVGNTAAAKTQVSGDGQKAKKTGDQDQR